MASSNAPSNREIGPEERYSEPVLSWVSELRRDEKNPKLSDVTLTCGPRSFKSHRCVLAASMPFFDQMFHSDMKEATAPVVNLSESDPGNIVTPESMDLIVQMIYGKDIPLSGENVYSLHSAANFLGLAKLADRCLLYIKTHMLTRRSVIDVWKYADSVFPGAVDLCDEAKGYMRTNFGAISRQTDFLALKWNDVKRLISIENLVVYFKNDILNAVVAWLSHDWDVRYRLAETALDTVDWSKVDFREVHTMQSLDKMQERVCGNKEKLQAILYVSQKLLHPSRKRKWASECSNSGHSEITDQSPSAKALSATSEERKSVLYFCLQSGKKKAGVTVSIRELKCFDPVGNILSPADSAFQAVFDRYPVGGFSVGQEYFMVTEHPQGQVKLHRMKAGLSSVQSTATLQAPVAEGRTLYVVHVFSNEQFFALVARYNSDGSVQPESKIKILIYELSCAVEPNWHTIPCCKVVDDDNDMHECRDVEEFVFLGTSALLGIFYHTNSDGIQIPTLKIFNWESDSWTRTPFPFQAAIEGVPRQFSGHVVSAGNLLHLHSHGGVVYALGTHYPKPAALGAESNQLFTWVRYSKASESLEWQNLPNLTTARSWPTVVCMNNNLYAVGGNEPMLFSCENSWEALDLGNVTDGWKKTALQLECRKRPIQFASVVSE